MSTSVSSPAVTVLIAVYNGMPYLPETIESIRRQTYRDWALLLVNDGSTDESAGYLRSIEGPRVRGVHQENQGLAGALNTGIALCDTEFVARIDADDVALPTRLEKQVAFLRLHPRVGLVGTQVAPLGTRRVGSGVALPCDHRTIDAALMRGHHALSHSSIMFRTELVREIGGYWQRGWSEDWDLYLRMAERTEVANLDEVLLYFRVLESSIQGRHMAEVRDRTAFANELARRRRQGAPAISYEEFQQQLRAAPLPQRISSALEAYAKSHYRRALPEILGDRPLRGYSRLAWAATCSPQLTWQRICRMARRALVRSRAGQVATSPALSEAGST